MSRKAQEIITFALVIGVLVMVALVSNQFFARGDLTENNVYSISSVSRQLFKDIPEQVHITYYLSDKLESRSPETQQIADILKEYAAFSHGKIQVDIVDPGKTGKTQTAEQLGVAPQQIQVIEQDQQSFAVVYTGIVISYLDKHKTLPVVVDPGTIEFELTSAIKNLVSGKTMVLGIVLGNNGQTLQNNYRVLSQQLSQTYDIRPLQPGDSIPPEVSVLFVLGAKDLDTYDLFPIDQYIMGGGKVLFAVDGVNVDLQQTLEATAAGNEPIFGLLDTYGVKVEQKLVLDTHNLRIPMQRPSGRVMLQTLEPYAHWVSVLRSSTNRDHPITARFSGLDLYWPSPLQILDPAKDEATVLVKSSPESWLMGKPFTTNPAQAYMFEQNADKTRGQYNLAVALSGSLQSYFKGKDIPTRPGVENDWKSITPSTDNARIVVVGDSKFASDLVQFSKSSYNITFVENVATWLGSDEDLLKIKTRATRDVRLNAIEDKAVRSRVAMFAQILNIYIIPLLVVVYGVVRFLRRREKASRKSGGEA